jgi:hypothetical protein
MFGTGLSSDFAFLTKESIGEGPAKLVRALKIILSRLPQRDDILKPGTREPGYGIKKT